jgi:hypothetical protein
MFAKMTICIDRKGETFIVQANTIVLEANKDDIRLFYQPLKIKEQISKRFINNMRNILYPIFHFNSMFTIRFFTFFNLKNVIFSYK